jgi:hypothetical protein
MKQVIYTFAFLLLILPAPVYSQVNLTDEEAASYSERFNQAGGTYQIQIIDSREKPAIQISLIDQIDAARKENDVTYISVKENIRIKVLPLSVINAPNFTAVERIVYLNSSDI